MPSLIQAVRVAVRTVGIWSTRAGLRVHVRKRETVMHVTGACRWRKAIRVARTGVSGADIMRGRKGMQEWVRVDRLAATARESLGKFVCRSARFSGRSTRISGVSSPMTHRVCKEVGRRKRYGRQSHGGGGYVGRRAVRRGRSGGWRGRRRRRRGDQLVRDGSRVRISLVRERHVGSASLSSQCVASRSEPASGAMSRRRSFPSLGRNKQRR